MSQYFDKSEIIKALELLKDNGDLFEIRILCGNATYSGYFRDASEAVTELSKMNLSGANTYFTLNHVKDACFSRIQAHRIIKMYGKNPTTSDNDIDSYSFLFIDIDPVRVSGTSSSNDELNESFVMAKRVYSFLQNLGFEEPIKALSGNGSHLQYKIDLENNDENKKLIQDCLRALDHEFSTPAVKIDIANHNPARICKLYGTLAQKGANTEERPYRMSKVFSNPEVLCITPREKLELLAERYRQLEPQQQPAKSYTRTTSKGDGFDVEKWLDKYNIAHKPSHIKDGDIIYPLAICPFDSSHVSSSAVIKRQDGRICFKCQHNSCQDYHWKDLRMKYEPDYKPNTSEADAQNKNLKSYSTPAPMPITLNNLDEAIEKDVEWLIPEIIPRGSVTLLAGDGGSGKTTCWCAIASAISNGEDPDFLKILRLDDDGMNPLDNTVFFFSAEDDVERVLLKRLKNAGANLKNIKYLSAGDESFSRIKFNSDELKTVIEQYQPTLCIFDPVQSFIPPEMRMGERNAMRQVLTPLMGFGEKYGTSFLLVAHTNKRANSWGRNRIADSADLWDACRSVIIVGQVPKENKRYFSQEKNNYAPLAQTRVFTINSITGRAEFNSFTEMHDQDYVRMLEHTKSAPDREEARTFIMDYLTDHAGETTTVGTLENSAKNYGISKSTFDRAKQELKKDNKIRIQAQGRSGKGNGTDWIIELI